MKKVIATLMIIALSLISACSSKPNFIIDENGHKQFRDKDGNFVKEGWAEISGNNYYFDLNGYLVTDQWVDNEYYVNKDGKMEKNYWYDDGNGTQYYLDENGKYVRDCIKNISGKEYAFNKDGLRIKNGVFVDSNTNKGYYIDAQGNVDKQSGYKNIGDTNCFVNESGEVIVNEWKEDDSKWYYYGSDGLMVKNNFVDGDFYVNENGEMVSNLEKEINGKIYVFDKDGKCKEKVINFNDLVEKYCWMTSYWGEKYKYPNVNVSNNGKMVEFESITIHEGTLKMLENINKEIGIPDSIVAKIKRTEEKDGLQKENFGKIEISWKVSHHKMTSAGAIKWENNWDEAWVLYSVK